MAAIALSSSPKATTVTFFPKKTLQRLSPIFIPSFLSPQQLHLKVKPFSLIRPSSSLSRFSPTFDFSSITTSNEVHSEIKIKQREPIRFLLWVLVWTSLSLVLSAAFGDSARAASASASDSIRASSFGLKFASTLRGSGWTDEAIVFTLATLPVVELRGAIPVGYWLQLKPWLLTLFSVLGNMVPVPFIVLYLKKFASFLAQKSPSASRFLDLLFERAREKASPVEEFQWLGLMLFVAVPFPGTGAWTGAIIASILDMPFWSAISANFCGVVLAGLLVNLLVNLGLKYAIATGILLFFISTFMWSILRNLKKSLTSSN